MRGQRLHCADSSASMLKLKDVEDAEYVVQGVETATMRIAVDGQYELRKALASVVIDHRGVAVSVGSGFSAAQRLRYAAHPEELIGCVVTVAYASESASLKRSASGGEAALSLRFPRVKAVFGKERDV